MYIEAFTDSVDAVRQSAAHVLSKICDLFGQDWAVSKFLPVLHSLWDGASTFIQRRTYLYCIQDIAPRITDKEVLGKQVLPRVMKACTNHVPNVRIVAVQTLQTLIPLVSPTTVKADIIPALKILCNDTDGDVKLYAAAALP